VTTVAILGGGQLGLMLGEAAATMDVDVRFLDPSADACAGTVGSLAVGALDDEAAVLDVAFGADVVTYEWEGVPAWSARILADTEHVVRPSPAVLAVSQDRLLEKRMATSLGLPTAPFVAVDEVSDVNGAVGVDEAIELVGVPAVVKTRRGGYDGKGQRVVRSRGEAASAVAELGGRSLIVESFVPFARELSILAARDTNGAVLTWPLVENHHELGILRTSLAPAGGADLQRRADEIASAILEHFSYVGVLAVELFDVDGRLLVNEIAPRVHNSGHWTIEGARTSQFENHLRAILDMGLGPTGVDGAAAMLNCVGALPDPDAIASVPGATLHDYGKAVRRGRKVGHVTIVADDAVIRDERVNELGALLPRDG